jgi:hypothetical protein
MIGDNTTMIVRLRYGKVGRVAGLADDRRDPDAQASWRPAHVVDSILGARAERTYVEELFAYRAEGLIADAVAYPSAEAWIAAQPDWFGALARAVSLFIVPDDDQIFTGYATQKPAALRKLDRELASLRQRFTGAALAATRGELSPLLARELAAIKRLPRGAVEVSTLAELGAWCLEVVLREGPITLRECENCGYPWIAERHGRFCLRPAPGQRTTCRALAAQSDFVAAHGDFDRERRKLYARQRRGTLSPGEYRGWKDNNHPGARGTTWLPFEEWDAAGKPAFITTKGDHNA